jgi:hypothetical protein
MDARAGADAGHVVSAKLTHMTGPDVFSANHSPTSQSHVLDKLLEHDTVLSQVNLALPPRALALLLMPSSFFPLNVVIHLFKYM